MVERIYGKLPVDPGAIGPKRPEIQYHLTEKGRKPGGTEIEQLIRSEGPQTKKELLEHLGIARKELDDEIARLVRFGRLIGRPRN